MVLFRECRLNEGVSADALVQALALSRSVNSVKHASADACSSISLRMDMEYAEQPRTEMSAEWLDTFWPPEAWYDLPGRAVAEFYDTWEWDSPEVTKPLLPLVTEEQHLLWAVDNIVGQICNGGFSQALYNSYGELAEEAILGLRKFGLTRHAELVDQAWSLFGVRPIPLDREIRIARLEALAEMEDKDPSPASLIEHASAVFTGTSERWSDLEDGFFALLHADTHGDGYNAAYYRPLAEWVYENRDRFFIL